MTRPIACVTGAGSGIQERRSPQTLGARGFHVVVTDIASSMSAERDRRRVIESAQGAATPRRDRSRRL